MLSTEPSLSMPEDFNEWTDTALVLKVGKFRETDLWLQLLTQNHGLISAFAFGGSKSRKRFCGCLDLLNELQIRIKLTKNGTYLVLQEGVLLQGPQKLRQDWSRLGIFMNCARFTEAMGVSLDNSALIFHLLKDILGLAETLPPGLGFDLIPYLYRLRLASEQGYAPDFQACQQCGQKPKQAYFMVAAGGLLCAKCVQGSGLYLSANALQILEQSQDIAPSQWQLAVTLTEKQECIRVIDAFVQYHLGLTWESGGFQRVPS